MHRAGNVLRKQNHGRQATRLYQAKCRVMAICEQHVNPSPAGAGKVDALTQLPDATTRLSGVAPCRIGYDVFSYDLPLKAMAWYYSRFNQV